MVDSKDADELVMRCDPTTGILTFGGQKAPTPIRSAQEFRVEAEHLATLGHFTVEFPDPLTARFLNKSPGEAGR